MSLLDEDEILKELYSRLGEVGWVAIEDTRLTGLVAEKKDFSHPSGIRLRIALTGPETLGFMLGRPDSEPGMYAEKLFEGWGMSPRRLNAVLDVLGIVATTDDWMDWYRETIWENVEAGTIAPS